MKYLGPITNDFDLVNKKYVDDNGGGEKNIWYGTCTTAATTAEKVVTTDSEDFVLETGNMIRIKMANANAYNGTATLNVDGTGAKSVTRVGTTKTTRYFWTVGEVVDFVYDGTYFVMSNKGVATITYYGETKLSSSTSSTSEALAATPKAVKTAYDLANSKANVVELTQAEYDALSQAEKTNGTVYFITDEDPDIPAVNDSVPIGAIQAYGGSTAPFGWLICDGSEVRRDTYWELFDVIGTTYGSGDGSTTFNLPDLKGRTIVGVGNSGATGSTNHTLGQKDGEETHILTVNEMPAHEHSVPYNDASQAQSSSMDTVTTVAWTNKWRPVRTAILPNGNNQSHNNMQPYVVTNYIIKAKEKTLVTATVPPLITDFIDVFYPVGSYYESSDASFNPNASWGGTWAEEIIKDDVIVEEGTSGIWSYEKWKSGKCKCWGKQYFDSTTATAWGSCYWTGPYMALSFPTNLFFDKPSINLTRSGGVEGWVAYVSSDKNGINNIYLVRPTAGTSGYEVSCCAEGFWKTYTAPNTKYKWHRTA